VNLEHLRAFVWLRCRLLANGWRRGGALNFAVTMIFASTALLASVPLFIGSFLAGYYALTKATPRHLLYIWDALVVGFVIAWCIGLLMELQRTESLSLSKFLHLPVSLRAAFAINYVSSLVSLSTLLFVPTLVGFCLGLAFARGLWLLAALPLSAAFLFMITAVSYQFQGWLASLMTNPRRRRAVIVGVTAMFVSIAQLPNLLNFFAPWRARAQRSNALVQKLDELNREFQSQKFDAQEHLRRQQEIIEKHEQENKRSNQAMFEQWNNVGLLLNWILPIGWLPLGVMAAAEGNVLIVSLALAGMTTIGAGGLCRAYRTTVRLYQGGFTAGAAKAVIATVPVARAPAKLNGRQLMEIRLPGLSEPVSAIALAGFRSLLRSPEAKMMLLTPLIMSLVIGGAFVHQPAGGVPEFVRPLAAVGGMMVVLFGMAQLMANQFGFDRDGFRVFVLCAAPRRDVLLGKNLAFFPWAAGMAALLVAVVEAMCRLRLDHLLALVPQFVSMFLLFCLLANLLSIYAPMAIAAGSLKPANQKILPVFLQVISLMFFFPLIQIPAFLPLGIEALLDYLGWVKGLPIFLVLAVAECAVVVLSYYTALEWEGRLLQSREKKILESVIKAG
jgi:ABC-2 type transport system permease protein